MLLIECPLCGPRGQAEFVYERSTDAVVQFEDTADVATVKLYERENPRGAAEEIWHHVHGCRGWLLMRRDRVTHAIEWVRPLGPEAMP